MLFIIGHIFTVTLWELKSSPFLLDAKDFGYPEIFQYLKYISILGFVAYLVYFKKNYIYIPLFFLFTFFLVDDMFQLHQLTRQYFISMSSFGNILEASKVRGYLIYSIIVLVFFLLLYKWNYRWASEVSKKSLINIYKFLSFFLFFGLGIDVLHVFFHRSEGVDTLLTIVEEGGEMLSLSILVWYFYSLVVNSTYINNNIKN
ncbi:hypothetical protein [Thalassobellus citreus]|uniref:hypothetical protein n=1 Tax=Thalassobellus citreus TaxID=3367752 RepID=UPI003790F270